MCPIPGFLLLCYLTAVLDQATLVGVFLLIVVGVSGIGIGVWILKFEQETTGKEEYKRWVEQQNLRDKLAVEREKREKEETEK